MLTCPSRLAVEAEEMARNQARNERILAPTTLISTFLRGTRKPRSKVDVEERCLGGRHNSELVASGENRRGFHRCAERCVGGDRRRSCLVLACTPHTVGWADFPRGIVLYFLLRVGDATRHPRPAF